ncbi:MAG: uracil-DNA glycosylase [Nanoarchaeota archaeon]|nr:uracil-DNA glycosylase [Nanoarchaeota archaeon]
MTLFELAEQIRTCTACPLFKERTLTVPGSGPENAKIMIIGEGPGQEEDRQGLPFIGRSGKLLTEVLTESGLDREEFFITNTVKCRPPDNRNPLAEEMSTCKSLWLDKQIELINPNIIVLLGNMALNSVLGRTGVTSLRGKTIQHEGRTYFPTLHPSAALRFVKFKDMMKEDFKKLKEIIEGKKSQRKLGQY